MLRPKVIKVATFQLRGLLRTTRTRFLIVCPEYFDEKSIYLGTDDTVRYTSNDVNDWFDW